MPFTTASEIKQENAKFRTYLGTVINNVRPAVNGVINKDSGLQVKSDDDRHAQITNVAHYPWMPPIQSNMAQGNGTNYGHIGVPKIGSKVFFTYMDDSDEFPVWIGNATTSNLQIAELLTDYPNAYGYIDAANNITLTNTQTKTTIFVHSSGAGWAFDGSGNKTDLTANYTLGANGTGQMRFTGTLELSAPTINIICNAMNVTSGANAPTVLTARPALT